MDPDQAEYETERNLLLERIAVAIETLCTIQRRAADSTGRSVRIAEFMAAGAAHHVNDHGIRRVLAFLRGEKL